MCVDPVLHTALMALLELDQSSFNEVNRLDMHALLEVSASTADLIF
jgi:hypothetical protein